jgi:uncharacterized RDD family membrane protein YckC
VAGGVRRVAVRTGVDRALEDATEEAIVKAFESPTAQRALERALNSPEVEEALIQALDSRLVDKVWDHLLESEEVQKLIERIAEAPEVRAAILGQGVGLFEDFSRGVNKALRRVDAATERIFRRIFFRKRRAGETDRAGLVSRAVAFGADIAILNAAFLVISGLVGVVLSVLLPDTDFAKGALLAFGTTAWFLAGAAYLLVFWSISGQTPGMRFVGLRILSVEAEDLRPRHAFRRLAGLVAGVLAFGLGLVPILTSERRRGLQDRMGRTEVFYETPGAARVTPWSSGQARQGRSALDRP